MVMTMAATGTMMACGVEAPDGGLGCLRGEQAIRSWFRRFPPRNRSPDTTGVCSFDNEHGYSRRPRSPGGC